MLNITIAHVIPSAYYPADIMAYKCKGHWVLSINGEPFQQSDDEQSLRVARREMQRDELALVMAQADWEALQRQAVGRTNRIARVEMGL